MPDEDNKVKNYILRPDGTTEAYPHRFVGGPGELQEAYKAIGGRCHLVQLGMTRDQKSWLIMDEEGKLKGLEINPKATELYVYGKYDPIVGTVIVMSVDDVA